MKYFLLTAMIALGIIGAADRSCDSLLTQYYEDEEIQLIAPGLISTDMGEYSPTYDRSRDELYFMRRTPGIFDYTIYRSKLTEAGWTQPAIVSFSGAYRDAAPYLSPDGNTLYFDSGRPASGQVAESINLWFSKRIAEDWSAPELLAVPSFNTAEEPKEGVNEFGPAVDGQGHLYFYSFRQPYRAGARYRSNPPKYDQVLLDETIPDPSANTFVSYLYISADGDLAILEGKAKDRWDSDLYCSCKNKDGSWNEPLEIPRVNTPANEGGPYLTADGQYLLFTSNRRTNTAKARNANHYMVKAESLLATCKARKK